MSDVETGTEWSHLLGRGMAGKLKDKRLKPIVCDMATWQVWVRDHPDTTVLNMPRSSKNYSSDFYRDLDQFVFGFIIAGKPHAISMADLESHPVQSFVIGEESYIASYDKQGTVARLFRAVVDDKELTFDSALASEMKDRQTGSTWDPATGTAISGPLQGKQLQQDVGIMSFRRAWKKFHPDSQPVSH